MRLNNKQNMKQTLLSLALIISLISKADEGMWLPQLLNAMNIKDMKKNGFKFVGPTTCYAFMQAVGMVNDHENSCTFR